MQRPGIVSPAVATLPWYRAATREQWRALVAASLGWMLDSMDVMLYSMVLTNLMTDLDMSRTVAGAVGSATLVASAAGGVMFGVVADRFGRARALIASIVIYSIFTAACGFAQTVVQLTAFRIGLGLGMGGEWATGATLVAETWPAEHRGKALGIVQSSWAIGYALAAVITAIVLPRWGWRVVFFVGVIPALFTIWIRRQVREPEIWQRSRSAATAMSSRLTDVLTGPLAKVTVALTLMNAGTMFAWWGLNLWIPAYLSLPGEQGGVGLSTVQMSAFVVVMQVGMWLGYVSYGFISDRIGRKVSYVTFLVAAAALVPVYAFTRHPLLLLALGPVVAFFGTGYFSGFGAITAELFPTAIRARAQGFTYNIGRLASAAAPFAVGSLAESRGFGIAFAITAAGFAFAAVMWLFIPETRGRALDAR